MSLRYAANPELEPDPVDTLHFWLNDRVIELAYPSGGGGSDVNGTTTLLRFLRDELAETGTKEGCAEGDCGACTVVLLEERPGEKPTFRAVNSCLLFLPMLQGKRVYTVEGLRDRSRSPDDPEAYHPAQLAMVETRGSQCGYCTPGIVMSLFEATYRDDVKADWQIDDQLCGNLCRCTGYRPIRDAGRKVAGLRPDDRFRATMEQYRARDAALDITAPDGLDGPQRYLQPTTFEAFFEARAAHPNAVLVAGGTDLGLKVTKFHEHFPVVIGLEGLDALREIERTPLGWFIGAGVNLTRVMELVGEEIPALHKMLRWFGSRQVRSRATLGGNLVNASPIGDTPPVLAALGAEIAIRGSAGERHVHIDDFFTGYRKTCLEGDELVVGVDLPRTPPTAFCTAYKVSKRRELDISAVAAGMYVDLDGDVVKEIRLAYGGMAATAASRARRTEAALTGQRWTRAAVEAAMPLIDADFLPIADHRGSARYRSSVARNLLLGFWLESQRADREAFDPHPVGTVLSGGAP
ncbi:MAG: xanthine dehydrogenase small subunit [Myxococcota bacterium]